MDPNDRYEVISRSPVEAEQIVSDLLDRINCENVNDTLSWGCTALHFACAQGNVEAVEKLLEIPGINVNCMDKDRWTPLHDACNENSFKVVEKLLAFPGIDVNIMAVDGKTPLHQALLSSDYDFTGNSQVISKLLAVSDIDVNIRDADGQTPLHYICSEIACDYNPEAIGKLLAVPDIRVNERGYNSLTAIMEAAKHGQTKALKTLLEDSRVDLNLKDKDGRSLEELVAVTSFIDVEHLETIVLIKEEKHRRENDMIEKQRIHEDSSGEEDTSDELESVRVHVRNQYAERLDRVWENIECEKFRLGKLAELKQKEMNFLKEKKKSEETNLEIKLEAKKVEFEKEKVELKEKIAKLEKQISGLDQSLIDIEQKKQSETESINMRYVEEVSKLEEKFKEEGKEDKLENFKKIKTQLTKDIDSFEECLSDNASLNDRKKVEAARDTLECPVCFETMSPPTRIWMCSVGHLVCEPCKNHLEERRCPTCRTGKVRQRSVMAENFARAVFN